MVLGFEGELNLMRAQPHCHIPVVQDGLDVVKV